MDVVYRTNLEIPAISAFSRLLTYIYTNVNRVVGDSGAVFTTETTRNSELKNAIFTIFALKLVELSSIKPPADNCENKASLWRNFKNSFAWLIGMKKVIFGFNNFLGSGHFLIHLFWKKWSRNDRSQKIFCIQKSVL